MILSEMPLAVEHTSVNIGQKVVAGFSDYCYMFFSYEFSAPATTFLHFYFMVMNIRLL